MNIYAIKAPNEIGDINQVYDSLIQGEARFGWSYIATADQRQLAERVDRDGWGSLNEHERDCYHDFLLRISCGDYFIYVNVPEWGKCTLARVTGEYVWRHDDADFNHRFPVGRDSVHTFDRNDAMVPAALCARLKLQGRWWTIYTASDFKLLLRRLKEGTPPEPRSFDSDLVDLQRKLQASLSEIVATIQDTFPGKELERFVQEIFAKVPGVKQVIRKEGRADRGADLIVTFEAGSIPGLMQTLVVQVKSYRGLLSETRAVKDIERAFSEYPEAAMGLIVSTATSSSDEFDRQLNYLSEQTGKPVSLLIGDELAGFILNHGGDLLVPRD